jgi:hypothetical protein
MDFTLTHVQRRYGETVLDFLLRNAHIRHCIHDIRFCAFAEKHARQEVEEKKLQEVLPLLTSLRRIEYYLHLLHNFDC